MNEIGEAIGMEDEPSTKPKHEVETQLFLCLPLLLLAARILCLLSGSNEFKQKLFWDGIITILGYDEFSLQQITIEVGVVQGEDEEEEARVK